MAVIVTKSQSVQFQLQLIDAFDRELKTFKKKTRKNMTLHRNNLFCN